MSETGAVKFSCEHVTVPLARFPGFEELNIYRRRLLQLRMLGVDASGIGYGNLSVRDGNTQNFYITGSNTGAKRELTEHDYARVTACNAERNWVRCEGGTIASSESLTHAAIYQADETVRAVIHGHSHLLWNRLVAHGPATSPRIDYGTSEMAAEVERLFRETDVRGRKLFAMGGHEDGVIGFGTDLSDASQVLTEGLLACG